MRATPSPIVHKKVICLGLLKPFEEFLRRFPTLQVCSFGAPHLYRNVFCGAWMGFGRMEEALETRGLFGA